MSAALDLLQQFDTIGARIENRNGRLFLRAGGEPIPLAMIAAARLAKDELLATVSARDAAPPLCPAPAAAGTSDAECSAEVARPLTGDTNPADQQPLLLRDGRRLWRFRAESIPEILNDDDIRPAVEARWCGCVLVADGHDLIVTEPRLSRLPDETLAELAANAGTIIAVLRGESRVRCAAARELMESGQ
jgi:hypothetical protein